MIRKAYVELKEYRERCSNITVPNKFLDALYEAVDRAHRRRSYGKRDGIHIRADDAVSTFTVPSPTS